jgi:ubiquinone biosynthesis protein
LKGTQLSEQLFDAYLKQILVDGFFHADPHPGNVFLTSDGRIALLDLGMTGSVTPRLQESLLQFVLAVSDGRGEDAAESALKIGEATEQLDTPALKRKIGSLVIHTQNKNLQQIQVGRIVLNICRMSAESGLIVPPELMLLGKTLLNLDMVSRTLDPEFDPNAAIRRNAAQILQQRVWKDFSPGHFFTTIVEMKDLVQRLPERLNKFLDAAANNDLKLKVDAIDERELISGLQKIANRITMGIILAALILGAAMLMRVETSFRIVGYPGFAIIFFFLAACGGLFLIFNILWHDRKQPK